MIRTYALLNVVAHPHPKGIYRKLFEIASERDAVKFRGDRFARISRITATNDGVFRGRLAMWTEIDPNSPSVDKASLEEQTLKEAGIELPANIGFNSSIFYFAFREDKHALYVELTNDEGRTITPKTAQRAILAILDDANIELVDDLSIYIGSRADAIQYVLGLKAIRKIEIDLNLPNPDDLSVEHQEALDRLAAMHAKRLQATLTKGPGEETLVLIPEWRVLAELARNNGSVKTVGIDHDGHRDERSTKDMPAEIDQEIADGDSSYQAVKKVAVDGRELGLLATDDDGEMIE